MPEWRDVLASLKQVGQTRTGGAKFGLEFTLEGGDGLYWRPEHEGVVAAVAEKFTDAAHVEPGVAMPEIAHSAEEQLARELDRVLARRAGPENDREQLGILSSSKRKQVF